MRVPALGTARRVAQEVAASEVVPNRLRTLWLRRLGIEGVHPSALLCSGITFAAPAHVDIGEGCFLNHQVYIDGVGVKIGRNVYVGPRAMFITASHSIGGPGLRAAAGALDPVVIGDGCWIGAGAILLPGVTVGSGCVTAAGAVVVKDCAQDGLYGGVPARRINDLQREEVAASESD